MSCSYTPGPVAFVYATWATRYPEFSNTVGPELAQEYFNEACLYLNNTATSPVLDNSVGGARQMYLNMLTAHIAALNAGTNTSAASPLVGRIDQATQGSVNVHAEMGPATNTMAWFMQTKYGAAFWQATAAYRAGGRYSPGARPYLGASRAYGYVSGPWSRRG